MSKPTTLIQLDAVLRSLCNHRSEKHFMFGDIAQLINEESSFVDFGDIKSILVKLQKDGYIEYDDRGVKDSDPSFLDRTYRVTFEGRYWIENGGYDAENRRDVSENTRLERLERTQIQYQIWLIWLTVILCAGTTLAAIYYVVELYWKYHWFH